MKRFSLPLLVLLNLALLAGIGGLWLFGETRWEAPAAQAPDPESLATHGIKREVVLAEALPQTLQRPLFAQTRRPPPPVEEVVAEAPPGPDPLQDVLLLGVFTVGGEKHLMLRAENKVSRLKQGDSFGPWKIGALDDRIVTFVQGAERRQLELKRAPQPVAARTPPAARRTARAAVLEAMRAGDEGADVSSDAEEPPANPSQPAAAGQAGAVAAPATRRVEGRTAAEAIAAQRGQR